MPNIKPELKSRARRFIETRQGESAIVASAGSIFWTLGTALFGFLAVFVSETLYPFTYPFIHTPLHEFLPRIATEPYFAANILFGALFATAVYNFERNIFYRRFHLALKAAFAAIAACVFVFASGLISFIFDSWGIGILSVFFLEADAEELPGLLIYYYLASLPLFYLCDGLRRRIFLLP